VDQISIVHVFYRLECLIEKFEGLDLAKSFVLMQIIEEIPMLCILEHDIDLPFLLEDLIEFDDILVSQSPVDKHLSPEVFLINSWDLAREINLKSLDRNLVGVNSFQSEVFLRLLMTSQLYRGKGPYPERTLFTV